MARKKSSKKKFSAKLKFKLSKEQRILKNKIVGLFFVSTALFVLTFSPQEAQQPQVKNSKDPIKISSKLLSQKLNQNVPKRIILPGVNIDLPIVQAKVVDGYWELSDTTASYGLGSGIPGTKSNTVIFAHARVGLFYNLKDVKINDVVYILTNNKWYRYRINKITAVYPNDTDVILPTKSETLTLYTCTGFYDEKRLIVQAVPTK